MQDAFTARGWEVARLAVDGMVQDDNFQGRQGP